MERTTFLGHYRISVDHNGAPRELGRAGPAITYEAKDERSGETVALKLIPISAIDPEARGQFEEQGSAAARIKHVNIAKVFDFGNEGDHFVYVSELLRGEPLASWVEQHGPMPADAVLRVAEQIVSLLSTARFHELAHCAIQPSNLIIVPGSTPEGSWPFVKLMDFPLPGLKSGPESFGGTDSSRGELDKPNGGDERAESFSVAPPFASPEQLQHQTVDFRSEVYSLGATMYFLLTGTAPSPEMRLRSRELSGFPKALRKLIGNMLRRDPDQRPKDPVALAEMIRECLLKVERRQALARKLGIPLAANNSAEIEDNINAARASVAWNTCIRRHCISGRSARCIFVACRYQSVPASNRGQRGDRRPRRCARNLADCAAASDKYSAGCGQSAGDGHGGVPSCKPNSFAGS